MNDSAYEREKRLRSLFTAPFNNYGYCLNVNNPTINAFYEDYIKKDNIFRPMSDNQRIAFEKALWKFFRKYYRLYDPKAPAIPPLTADPHISEKLFGWRYEQFQIFINDVLDIQKAVELFHKVKIEVKNNDKS